jgi:hypothetical protein
MATELAPLQGFAPEEVRWMQAWAVVAADLFGYVTDYVAPAEDSNAVERIEIFTPHDRDNPRSDPAKWILAPSPHGVEISYRPEGADLALVATEPALRRGLLLVAPPEAAQNHAYQHLVDVVAGLE